MKRPIWLTKHLSEKIVPYTFETLFTMNVPRVLERIFFSLDYESFEKCKKVCVAWNSLLKSKLFKTRAKSHFATDISRHENKLWCIYGVKKVTRQRVFAQKLGLTPLCFASKKNKTKVVKALLEKGAEVDQPDGSGNTPLYWAAVNGNKDVAQFLHDAGAQPNTINEHGKTPLHVAATLRDKKMAMILLECGADYDMADKAGFTPLHLAVGSDQLVQLLLREGANPNKADEQGRTPLHAAASLGLNKMAKILIECGADYNMADKAGFTPLHWAVGSDQINAVQLLKTKLTSREGHRCIGQHFMVSEP